MGVIQLHVSDSRLSRIRHLEPRHRVGRAAGTQGSAAERPAQSPIYGLSRQDAAQHSVAVWPQTSDSSSLSFEWPHLPNGAQNAHTG